MFPYTGSNSGLNVVPVEVRVSAAIASIDTESQSWFFYLTGIYSHIFTVHVVQIFKINLLIFYIAVINKK